MVVHRRQADPRKDGRTCLPPCGHVAALLDTHAADLDRRIAELTALREEVGRLRDRA